MTNLDLNRNVNEDRNHTAEAAEIGYERPELHEIGRSRDLVQGASCCGPYDGRGYFPQ
jgi:hypothetical protein